MFMVRTVISELASGFCIDRPLFGSAVLVAGCCNGARPSRFCLAANTRLCNFHVLFHVDAVILILWFPFSRFRVLVRMGPRSTFYLVRTRLLAPLPPAKIVYDIMYQATSMYLLRIRILGTCLLYANKLYVANKLAPWSSLNPPALPCP